MIDPRIKSSLIEACNAPPLKYTITGQEARSFQRLMSEQGVLTLFGLNAGHYKIAINAQSKLNPEVKMSLKLTIFIRDLNFVSPFPTTVNL